MLVKLYNLLNEVSSGGQNYFVGFNFLTSHTCQSDIAEVLSCFLKESACIFGKIIQFEEFFHALGRMMMCD